MASPKMSLKLLVDRKGSRVLFAEAPKDFVDFLFHIFSLPLGTLIEFLGSKQMVGCLGNLKDSIESFHGDYLQPDIKIDDIFSPKTTFNGNTFLLSYDVGASSKDQSEAVYRCEKATRCSFYSLQSDTDNSFEDQSGDAYLSSCDSSSEDQSGAYRAVYRGSKAGNRCSYCCKSTCRSNATLHANSTCPNCSGSMNVPMTLIMPKEVDKKNTCGYVKEMVTYMVMDNLVVKPMSTISSITLLNKFGVKDLSQLEEKVVSFGKDEGLKLLKASLKTDKVLTAIFMH